jgi:hypothetical protein
MTKPPQRLSLCLLSLLLCAPMEVYAFNNSYDCRQVGDTSIGWDSIASGVQVDSTASRSDGILVKLIELNSESPKLAGQSVADLIIVHKSESLVSMIEVTPSGTVVTWTLFLAEPGYGMQNPVLISSKSYSLAGPVNFTTYYDCSQA